MTKANKKQKKIIRMLKQFENDKYVLTLYEQVNDIEKIFRFINQNYIHVHCFSFIKNNPEFLKFFKITRTKALEILKKVEDILEKENIRIAEKTAIEKLILVLNEYLEKDKYYTKIFLCMTKTFGKDLSYLILEYL